MKNLIWHIEKRSLNDLKFWDKNPRQISKENYERLKQRIVERGFHDVLKLDENNVVLSGNQRLKALRELNFKEVDCKIPNRKLTDEEKDKIGLESNINDGATDFNLLMDNFDLELLQDVGFSEEELKIDFSTDDLQEDEAPEVGSVGTVSKLGDVWQLGRHKIICGDCIEIAVIDKLFKSEKCNLVLTDPPYGVGYSNKNECLNKFDNGSRSQSPIVNDNIQDYRQFFIDFLSVIPFAECNILYCFMHGLELHNLRLALEDCNIKWGDYLVWVKNNHVLGRKDYNSKHEFIVYGWKGKHNFYGDFSTTILEFDRPHKSDLHPTMKPIALLCKLLTDGSRKNDIIYDAFLGSGSTLIACEQADRICYGVEIEPRYIDVIIARWEKFTHTKAVLLA